MPYSETCSHCGHQATAYIHRLSKRHVKIAEKLLQTYQEYNRPLTLKDFNIPGLTLTNTEYTSFQSLQYLGLAVHNYDTTAWLPTEEGIKFLTENAQLLDRVMVLNNQIVPLDHPAWEAEKVKPKMVYRHELTYENIFGVHERRSEKRTARYFTKKI